MTKLYSGTLRKMDDLSSYLADSGMKFHKRWRWKHVHWKESDVIDQQFVKDSTQYWSQYTNDFDPIFHKLYSSRTGVFDVRYIPDDLYYTKIEKHFNNIKFWLAIDDKNYYSLWFPEARQPFTVVRKINNIFYDDNYELISIEEAIDLCKLQDRLIIKPAIGVGSSKGIHFWDQGDPIDNLRQYLYGEKTKPDIIVQKIVEQHEHLNNIHEHSLNTIRVITLLFQNQVYVLSSVLRMGSGGSRVDNVSAGGFVCGIKPDGRLKDAAWRIFDKYGTHPQGILFGDIVVPSFQKVIYLASQLQTKMAHFRLISWDIGVDSEGEPVLIETNLHAGSPDIHQICNGPLFGDLTEAVLNEVFTKPQAR